ncbi:MAG: hypothetical protein R3D26_14880 [Cyanobacteriota/Melainabacteria group bacterium]
MPIPWSRPRMMKASTRIALGSILLENKDEKAKVVLSEAYSLGASSGLLQVAGDLAVAAGAKPSDLIGGLLEQSSKEVDSSSSARF